MIKVLLIIFGPTLLGLMESTGDTYIILNALGDAPFYFLPVMVAYTASKKLNCNSFLSVTVAAMLLYPDLITLLGGDAPTYLFGVISGYPRQLFVFHHSGDARGDLTEICGDWRR